MEAFKKSLRIEPNRLFAHFGLVATYDVMGREENAGAEAAEALRIDPDFSVEHFAKVRPHVEPANTARFADALRKAGLK